MSEETAFTVLGHHARFLVYGLDAGRPDDAGTPASGSPAALEAADTSLAGVWGADPARQATNLGRTLAAAASDHLLALADLLKSEQTGAFAAFTIGRGLLETAARSWYLLEPAIEVRERVRRHMNERLWSLHESGRFLGGLKSDTRALDELTSAITQTAQAHGFVVRSTRGGPQLGEARPSSMGVCDLLFPVSPSGPKMGSASYQFLSSSAHGGEAGLAGHLQQEADGQFSVVKHSEEHARYLLWPLRAYVEMGDRLLAHFGWNTEHWVQCREDALAMWVEHALQGLDALPT
jgi:hypothetical protein